MFKNKKKSKDNKRKLHLDIESGISQLESGVSPEDISPSKIKKKGDGEGFSFKRVTEKIKNKKIRWEYIISCLIILLLIDFIILIFIYAVPQNDAEKFISEDYFTSENQNFLMIDKDTGKILYDGEEQKITYQNVEEFIQLTDTESCVPEIICEYEKKIVRYGVSDILSNSLNFNKDVIICRDSAGCISSFHYIKQSEDIDKQEIQIKKISKGSLEIYDSENNLIAIINKTDIEDKNKLDINLIL